MTDDRDTKISLTIVIDGDPPREVTVDIPQMMVKKLGRVDGHRSGQEVWAGRRAGGDGRWVRRDMVIDRDAKPPFKWHRVVDEETGEVLKDEAINLETDEAVDLRNEDRPAWLPEIVRYESEFGFAEYAIAPDEMPPRSNRMHLTEEQAQALARELMS
jgi:hypothetical protein